MKCSIIGCGKMGSAVVKGLIKSGFKRENIFVFCSTPLSTEKKINALGVSGAFCLEEAIVDKKLIFLLVKPHQILSLFQQMLPYISDTILLSCITGISISDYEVLSLKKINIVRLMPNISVQVGKGMIGVNFSPNITPEDYALVSDTLGGLGQLIEVNESLLDSITAINGSGPAFVLLLVEAFIEEGINIGMSLDQARQFASGALMAACSLIQETTLSPSLLRNQITTPNGVTAVGLDILQRGNFLELIRQAIHASYKKSQKIEK